MKIDFLIFYEFVSRDFNYMTLIKKELEARGYSVKICSFFFSSFWKSLFYRPKVIITTSLRTETDLGIVRPYRGNYPIKVINMQIEQAFAENEYTLEVARPHGRTKDAYHVCWGPIETKRELQWGVKQQHIINSGAIHFDFIKGQLNNIYKNKEEIGREYDIDYRKKWILFNSTFVCQALSDIETKDEEEKKYYKECAEIERPHLIEIVGWFEKLQKKYNDYIIIYRPHPAEKEIHPSIIALENEGYIRVIRDYSVQQWIKVADVVTSWNCTTAVEAYFAKKPNYGLTSISDMANIGAICPVVNDKHSITSYEMFEKVVTQDDSRLYILDNEEYGKLYGYTPQDEEVYFNLCNQIEKIYKEGESLIIEPTSDSLKWRKGMIRESFLRDMCRVCPNWIINILKIFDSHKAEVLKKLKEEYPEFKKENLQYWSNKIEQCRRNI